MLEKAQYWAAINGNRDLATGHRQLRQALSHESIDFHASAPVGSLNGADMVDQQFWQPLLAALPDLERRTDILLSGAFRDGQWFASTG